MIKDIICEAQSRPSFYTAWEVNFISRIAHYFAHNLAVWSALFSYFGSLDISLLPSQVISDYVAWEVGC